MAGETGKSDKAPTREQAVRAVRIFGGINLAVSIYMILGAIMFSAGGAQLPLTAAERFGTGIGWVVVAAVWGTGLGGGVGLLLRSNWGRRVAYWWGRVIVWVLPIGFGLASRSLKAFISLQFLVIIVLCIYASVMAFNLARSEFDVGFRD